MQAADLICIGSVCREGFGLAAAEAMILGKTVIVSNRGALPDIAEGGKAALVIDPDRPEQLTAALRELATNSEAAHRLTEYASVSVRQRFSYERWGAAVAEVLRDAAAA